MKHAEHAGIMGGHPQTEIYIELGAWDTWTGKDGKFSDRKGVMGDNNAPCSFHWNT